MGSEMCIRDSRKSKGQSFYDVSRTHGTWSSSTVLRMLEDERYIGTYVIGKRAVTEIGGHRIRLKDESEWYKIPDHHPAIVSKELFEQAKAGIRRFSIPNKKRHDYPLRGKVFCGCCDHALSRTTQYPKFYCRHSQVNTDFACHGMSVKAEELETAVFQIIRAQVDTVLGVDGDGKDSLDLQMVQQSEYEKKVQVFHNILDTDRIAREAQLPGGFSDSYTGIRILTVGRLAYQKAYDIAIPAMKKIREDGYEARWYVLGEGSERNALEKQIAELGLQEDFQLPGAKENLFPYYAQCDLYVHATRFEGKSIAIQEAQTLGCAVIASDCAGNREQIGDGEDGLLCTLTPEGIAEEVEELLDDPKKRERLGAAAKQKMNGQTEEIWKLLNLMK